MPVFKFDNSYDLAICKKCGCKPTYIYKPFCNMEKSIAGYTLSIECKCGRKVEPIYYDIGFSRVIEINPIEVDNILNKLKYQWDNKVNTVDKKIFVINGLPGSGKTTFEEVVSDIIPSYICSSIDEVKRIARECGWNGVKDPKDRKFLSDLKALLNNYNQLPVRVIEKRIEQFLHNEQMASIQFMFIDIREEAEINYFVKEYNAKTILVTSDRTPNIKYGNESDDNIQDIAVKYDYLIDNNITNDLKQTAKNFVAQVKGTFV